MKVDRYGAPSESRAECWCWEHGNLRDGIWEWITEEWITEEWIHHPGLAMAIGRIEIERKRSVD